jgi:peptidoglycan/LPS O-acetylase OafA/YrhL
MSTGAYRPDIDGLRAVSVLAVVLFHARAGLLPGGFVGVDVFFVISGFLITRLIRDERLAGAFSWRRFYLRRARRLLSALFATLALTFVAGAWLLAPQHLEKLARSTLAALGFVANIEFWAERGYFDSAAQFKPLLHTWSLAVEEQFYMLWPLLLTGLLARGISASC